MYESFAAGAFDKALANSDVRAFVEHDRAKLLGRQSAGTLSLEPTPKGLAYKLELPNTSYANDLKELIARGDLNEMSFGFIPGKYSLSKEPDGIQMRTHTEAAALVDISPVSLPAFEGTSIVMHSMRFDDETPKSQAIRIRNRLAQKKETND